MERKDAMRVLGVSGSPREDHTTHKLVREVLSTVECETEFVSLAGLTIGPCIACLACARDNVCKVEDDMQMLRQKIVDADAYGKRVLDALVNALNGHCRDVDRVLSPSEHVDLLLLADYFGLRLCGERDDDQLSCRRVY